MLDLDRGDPTVDEFLVAQGRDDLGQLLPTREIQRGSGSLRSRQDVHLEAVGGLPADAGFTELLDRQFGLNDLGEQIGDCLWGDIPKVKKVRDGGGGSSRLLGQSVLVLAL